jgi:hypothetical protein
MSALLEKRPNFIAAARSVKPDRRRRSRMTDISSSTSIWLITSTSGLEGILKKIYPVLTPKHLPIEHVRRRADNIGCNRIGNIFVVR